MPAELTFSNLSVVENSRNVPRRKSLLSPDHRERLSGLGVGHVGPIWLSIAKDLPGGRKRDYGGVEDFLKNLIDSETARLMNNLHLFGHADNHVLKQDNLTTVPTRIQEEQPDELISLLRKDKDTANDVALHHVMDTYDQLAEMADNGTIHVVHDHSKYGRSQRLNVPVLITEHGIVAPPGINKRTADFYRASRRQNVWSIAISNAQRETANLNWLAVIPNGINLEDFDFKADKGDSPLGEYGLSLGLIARKKGVHHAIDASMAAGLVHIIAGPKEDEEYYRTEILPRIRRNPGRIYEVGSVNALQRRILYANASVFYMLGDFEPFGMVVTEAMASGTAVVASKASGAAPEIMGTVGGIVVDDPQEAGKAVMMLQHRQPHERRWYARKARERVEDEYSIEVMAERYALAYLEAMDRASGRSKATGLMSFV
jgi:glycosyltransferase involved in cell wall biosynthesis